MGSEPGSEPDLVWDLEAVPERAQVEGAHQEKKEVNEKRAKRARRAERIEEEKKVEMAEVVEMVGVVPAEVLVVALAAALEEEQVPVELVQVAPALGVQVQVELAPGVVV